jgi:sulfide:quinone oxidoreductase
MTPLKGGGQRHHQVLIVGGGSGGITVASQLLRASPGLDVAILEPAAVHEYQSGWILAGAGLLPYGATHRPESAVIPAGATWIHGSAATFEPEAHRVITASGDSISYDLLVVAMGLQLNWSAIKGLPEALGWHGIVSNYSHPHIAATWEAIRGFQGGTALFTHPATPIKCGGAPQKVMYLADDIFQATSGVGVNTRVIFCSALAQLYPVKAYNATVERVVARRGIETSSTTWSRCALRSRWRCSKYGRKAGIPFGRRSALTCCMWCRRWARRMWWPVAPWRLRGRAAGWR